MALGEGTSEEQRGVARRTALAAAGAVALAVILWGGYTRRWPWTGINGGTATLWDWLHLVLLPLAAAALPTWFRHDTRVHARSKRLATAALAIFAVVVILGYAVPWGWTGFRGNTVWDWFNLVFLPLTLVLIPWFVELRRSWQARHTVMTGLGLAIFMAFVLGGYLADWTWTGFTGNTLWNWLQLVILPLLVPTVILPAVQPIAMRQVVYLDEHGHEVSPPSSVVAESAVPTEGAAPQPAAPAEPAAAHERPATPDLAQRPSRRRSNQCRVRRHRSEVLDGHGWARTSDLSRVKRALSH